jgi:1,4-alpha-glucan branching enzyme
MPKAVHFIFNTGISRTVFSNVRLSGSWDASGSFSTTWSSTPMKAITGADGCPAFEATVNLNNAQAGQQFQWGVTLDAPNNPNIWGIMMEVPDANSSNRYRVFNLAAGPGTQEVQYWFANGRRLGAQKFYLAPGAPPQIVFSVWAPDASAVNVVFGNAANGYIPDNGTGLDPTMPIIKLTQTTNGEWASDPTLYKFSDFVGKPYMFQITNEQGAVVYRTDIYSRHQLGDGSLDPGGAPYTGTPAALDGGVACSVVVDPDTIQLPSGQTLSLTDFWKDEFTASCPVPTRLEDVVIYELHVGSLGFGNPAPGNLMDAIAFLDHLVQLGVNAVELMPMAQYNGDVGWGYGDSHHMAIQSAAGGNAEYRMFIKACHQRGLAVIQDVCYNHFDNTATRDEYQYDSTTPNNDIYYWYDPVLGYLQNGSSGRTPRFWDEHIRTLFIASAVMLIEDCHVDGFRMDLTDAIHQNNPVANANLFGCKFLREWSRTARLLKSSIMLAAEDYTGWDMMTQLPDNGGMGFDAVWYADFIHHLQGDGNYGDNYAKLVHNAGFGGSGPLQMDYFGGALEGSGDNKIVYHENHDESGNEGAGTPWQTHRTMVVAVNGAPIIGATRAFAEARCRFAMGMNILSAGTPMFFMAEEIGAQNDFLYQPNLFMSAREDILGQTTGNGANLFRFYQDIIRFRLAHPSVRTHGLGVAYTHDVNRVIAFVRTEPTETILVIGTLSNVPYGNGYALQCDPSVLADGSWTEIFNSDATQYGGAGIGNFGATVPSQSGNIQVRIPANGFLIFSKK